MLPGSCFHLATPGPDAAWFSVECSTDLVNWTSICTNQVINGSIDFVDPDAASNSSRFYRAVPLNQRAGGIIRMTAVVVTAAVMVVRL